MDAPVPDPVPFERGDLAEAVAGQHQQADNGDDVRTPELVAGQHGVEPGHFLRRQEPLYGLHPVAPGIPARVGFVGAVSPKLGHAHHHGQHRHGAVGDVGPVAHGGKPVLDLLDRDDVHGHAAEGGQDVVAHDVGVGLAGRELPVPGLPVEELGGEDVHRISWHAGATTVPDRFGEGGNQPAGLAPRLGDGHGVGVAKGGEAPAPARCAVEGEAARAGGGDPQEQAGNQVVPNVVAPGARLGGADAPGEGGFGLVAHDRGSRSGRAAG